MWSRVREMPGGIRLFLVYAFMILAVIGLLLRFVVDEAINAPISFNGVVVMVLLAYTIFTITLIFQRKQAARGLAIGLATLTLPAIPFAALSPQPLLALFIGALALLLFRGLLRPEVRTYLDEI
jgi:predicted lysophospholipase L1 biosynthesis ABC-type transport system permease subunit